MNMQLESEDVENKVSDITILYEDDQMLAVCKPAGLIVHADLRTKEPTLSDWIIARYPNLKDVGGLHTLDSERYVVRAGILHRLDRETSGVILVAKNDDTFYFLQRQFLDRTITKIYNAFVHGIFAEPSGVIEFPIGRSRSDFRKWATGDDARGTLRKAVTEYRVLSSRNNFSFLELVPKTGRTHQLRVHMGGVGHQIVCDKRYGSPCALGFTRLALHARKITFTLPSGKQLSVEAPLPPDFLAARKELS